MSDFNSSTPFYYMIPTEEDGNTSFEIRYADNASNLMTVALESPQDPLDDQKPADDSSRIDEDVMSLSSSDEDEVIFVAESKEMLDFRQRRASKKIFKKPCSVVKPFEFSQTHEVVELSDDDKDDEEYYRSLFDKFRKEDECDSSDDFTIHNICDDNSPTIKSDPLTEETLKNYSGEERRSRSPSSSDSDNFSDDPSFIPNGPPRAKYWKKKLSKINKDPTFMPDEPSGSTKYYSVYQTVSLNKYDTNRSRITFCDRIIQYVETSKDAKTAKNLCSRFWESLSIRMKRKYLPRSKYALCESGPYERNVRAFSTQLE